VTKAERELREEILRQLKRVTKANSPKIWERIQTKEGYSKLEEQIIYRVVNQHLVPAAIIPQMETELQYGLMLTGSEHITPTWLRERITAIRKLMEDSLPP
jgi:hypothetical protein